MVHHGSLPYDQVMRLVKEAHFGLLPTFSDSFGFSAIESMACNVPMIATMQGALPEFITEENGIPVSIETDENGEWVHINKGHDRTSKQYEQVFSEDTDKLVEEMFKKLKDLIDNPEKYKKMRTAAGKKARDLFCAQKANAFWDDLYEEVLS